jgi:translocation and assembly module TamB
MRRALKISAWFLGSVALLLIAVVGGLIIFGNTDVGRRTIERVTYNLTGGNVKLSGLSGSFPRHLLLDKLELRDSRGVWLTAEKIVLDWLPLAYVERRLQIDYLHVAKVDMERLPQSAANTGSGPPSIPRIDVSRVSIAVVQLGAELAGSPATLTASGSAHLRSVEDMLFEVIARRIDGDGQYEMHLHFDRERMDAALTLHEPASGPLENILNVPGLGALQGSLNLSGPRAAEQLQISLQAGGLQGHVEGSLNLKALSADLNFAFESSAMQPREDLAWDRGIVRGRWHGDLKSPSAEAHLDIQGLRVPGDIQLASLKAEMSAQDGNAAAHVLVGGIRIPGPQPRLLADGPLTLDATMRLDDLARRVEVTGSHRLFALRGQAIISGAQSATLELKLPNLAPFAALAGQDIRGSAVVNAQLDSFPAKLLMKLDAALTLVPGAQGWAPIVGDHARLKAAGSLKDTVLTVDNANFTGRSLSVSADGTLNRRYLKARWQLGLADLSALAPALTGTLQASGSLDGALTALAAEAKVSSNVSVRGSQSGTLLAEAKIKGLPNDPNGGVAVHGTFDGAPLNVEVDFDHAKTVSLHAVVHHADWKSAHIDGDISLVSANSNAPAQGKGQMSVAIGELGDFQHLLGIHIGGSLAGKVELKPDGQRTRAQLEVDAKNVALADLTGDLHLSGNGFTDAFGFKAAAEVSKLMGAPASASVDGNLNFDARSISISTAALNYKGQEARLLAPARIDFAAGISVDTLKLGAQTAVLTLKGQIAPTLAIQASLHNLEPALVDAFVPNLLATGSISGSADVRGSTSAAEGEIRLDAIGIRFGDDAAIGLPPADLRVTAVLKGQTADINAKLDAGPTSQLSAIGQAPIALNGPIDMNFTGKLDVGLINPFLEARGQHAGGQVTIDASVTGNAAAPIYGGTLILAGANFKDYGRGISISDIAAQITGGEGELQIKSFTASAPPGTLSMSGSVGITRAGIPLDLKITAKNAQPLVSKLITANFDADIAVTGTASERLDVKGTVNLHRTLIGIPNGLPPNVAVLDVRRRGKPVIRIPEKPLIVGLDLTLNAPQQILVQGRGLDAEMGGSLRIRGTTDAPLVSGGFDLQRGSFSLGSNKLNITAGRVGFNGFGLQRKIDPTLDFTAQTTLADNTTATLHITGLADAPLFDFSSSPPLPPDQIMALLLFGAPANTLSAIQLAQTGLALASLSGVGGDGSLNPLLKIQKSLGLDRLTVGNGPTNAAGENTGASIAAGRYISKRVYIEAKQNTTGTSQLEADVDLTKHLKLQTRLGNGTATVQGTTPENDPGSSIGLFYQFEY